jgi:hypothetical protein
MADIYTVESLARDADVPPKAIVKWIKQGLLPAANLGSWLFPHYVMTKGDVTQFLKSRACKYTHKAQEKENVSSSREGDAVSSD